MLNGSFTSPALAVPPALAAWLPALATLLPEWRPLPAAEAPPEAPLAWRWGDAGPPAGRALLPLSEGPWAAPRFPAGQPLVGLAVGRPGGGDPLAEGDTRFRDPFRDTRCTAAEAEALLAEWRALAAADARLAAATGMEVFKRARMAARLGIRRFFWRGSAAVAQARAQGGAVLLWSAMLPPGLAARAAAQGVPLVQVEDGFIRSAGLGVALAPAQSLVLDAIGMHFDPSRPSELETLLQGADFAPELLARAARLRGRLRASGITKYNLRGPATLPGPPPGRRAVLVCGQVEDDASIRRGGGAVRTNLALLRAARAEHPDAWLVYKPHPDVEAGIRRGAIDATGLADVVAARTPIAPLYDLVEEVQVMSSLAGFEALLRGRRVVCHGQPFYAGWGLTEDRAPLPRRSRRLTLDQLVAGALIRYPRYWDPVTGLPCPVEVLLDRLETMPAPPPPRLPRWLRGAVARASGAWTRFWVAR